MQHHVEAWDPYDDQKITLSGGPVRVVDKGADDPDFVRRPVGFSPPTGQDPEETTTR